MHPADIRARLAKKGSSQAQIARKLRVSENAVSLVVRQIMTSARIMRNVSDVIGIPEQRVFNKIYARKAKAASRKV